MTRSAAKRANRNARMLAIPYDLSSDTVDSVRRLAVATGRADAEINYAFAVSLLNEKLRDLNGEGRVRPRHNYPNRFPLLQPTGEYYAPDPAANSNLSNHNEGE